MVTMMKIFIYKLEQKSVFSVKDLSFIQELRRIGTI